MDLKIESEIRGNTLCVTLEGELTLTQSPGFKNWVTQALDPSPVEGELMVEVDCRELTYIDSTGLGALIFLRKAVLDRTGTLRLTQVSGWLRKFLQVTGLEETFIGGGKALPAEPTT